MTEYVELYDNSFFKLYGILTDTVDGYKNFAFHVEMKWRPFSRFSCDFADTGLFCLPEKDLKQYCKQLKKMYDSFRGECLIYDYDFGNELKLFFDGRQLKMSGKFSFGNERSEFSDAEIDQTIIPRLLTLLQAQS